MAPSTSTVLAGALVALGTLAACGSGDDTTSSGSEGSGAGSSSSTGSSSGGGTPTNPQDGPPAGYPDGHAPIPAEAQEEDVSSPTTVIGDGKPASCTGEAFVNAVAQGGVITFDCGPDPVTIVVPTAA